MEEALYDTPMFHEFCGLNMNKENLLAESAILSFHDLPEEHQLSLQLLATVNATSRPRGCCSAAHSRDARVQQASPRKF